jgi:hypothetical protein
MVKFNPISHEKSNMNEIIVLFAAVHIISNSAPTLMRIYSRNVCKNYGQFSGL